MKTEKNVKLWRKNIFKRVDFDGKKILEAEAGTGIFNHYDLCENTGKRIYTDLFFNRIDLKYKKNILTLYRY